MSSVSADTRAKQVAPLDPATYVRHAIHGEDRTWTETNCYTDLVIELVHGLGHDPVAMLPFTLAIDFEGDQWTFFKPPAADLFDLYGIDLQELAIWRPLAPWGPPGDYALIDASVEAGTAYDYRVRVRDRVRVALAHLRGKREQCVGRGRRLRDDVGAVEQRE